MGRTTQLWSSKGQGALVTCQRQKALPAPIPGPGSWELFLYCFSPVPPLPGCSMSAASSLRGVRLWPGSCSHDVVTIPTLTPSCGASTIRSSAPVRLPIDWKLCPCCSLVGREWGGREKQKLWVQLPVTWPQHSSLLAWAWVKAQANPSTSVGWIHGSTGQVQPRSYMLLTLPLVQPEQLWVREGGNMSPSPKWQPSLCWLTSTLRFPLVHCSWMLPVALGMVCTHTLTYKLPLCLIL